MRSTLARLACRAALCILLAYRRESPQLEMVCFETPLSRNAFAGSAPPPSAGCAGMCPASPSPGPCMRASYWTLLLTLTDRRRFWYSFAMGVGRRALRIHNHIIL